MKLFSSILVLILVSTSALYAKKPEHAGNGNKGQKNKSHKHEYSEENTVNEYYRSLPPGLQKKMKRGGELPPGWAKKMVVGKPVPDEYMKIAVPAPDDLKLRLKIDSHTKLLQIANRLLKVEVGSNRLLAEIKF